MFALHCTAKLRDRLARWPQLEKLPTSTAFGDWYATALFWRPQLAPLVNERTLLPMLVPLASAATLPECLGPALGHVLLQYGVGRDFLDHEVAEMSEAWTPK
jgi:hypothetical protein